MKIEPIASGSSGNAYWISDGKTSLLIDCGIRVSHIERWCWGHGHRLSELSGCLVSHSHGDHVKSARKLANRGIDIYTSPETIEAAGLTGSRIHAMKGFVGEYGRANIVTIGSMWAYALEVEHDAPGTYAFMLKPFGKDGRKTGEKLLYITDTEYFRYDVRRVTHLMIEANYDPDIIADNVSSGRIGPARAKRTVSSHMSIETTLLTLERMDRSALKEVWLLHLSNDNAADDFRRRVQEITGTEVYIA